MLQSIRDRTHGWIAGVIISLIILSFALWGIHSYLGGGASDIVAKVNGVDISRRQLAAALEPVRRQMQLANNTALLSEKTEQELRTKALDALINLQVLKDAANAQGYRVSSEQIYNYLYSIPDFQVDGQFSLNRFQQFIHSGYISADDFFDQLRTNLIIQQPRAGIVLSALALPDEIKNTIALVNQERDVAYMTLTKAYFQNQNFTVSDAEAERYYREHENDFKTPEQVSIDYVVLSLKELLASIKVDDAMLKDYYNDNLSSFNQPPQWMLQSIFIPLADNASPTEVNVAQQKSIDIQKNLTAGSDFAALSKQYPDPTNTKLEFKALSDLPVELRKPVSDLKKVGDTTDPIKTSKGIVILKAIQIKPQRTPALVEVKDKVLESVKRQQAQEKFATLREKLSTVTYEHPDSLDAATKELALPIKTSMVFNKEKGGDDISANAKIREVAFSTDVLSSQNNSDVVEVDPETYAVIRIKTHTPSAVQPFEKVKGEIQNLLKAQKAEEKAKQVAEEIQHKLANGSSITDLGSMNTFAWNKIGYIGRYSTKVDSAILFTAFRMPKPKDKTAAYAVTKTPEGYAVVAVNAIKEGTLDPKPDQNDVFAEQVQNSEGMLENKLYEQSLVNQAKVKVYQDQAGS